MGEGSTRLIRKGKVSARVKARVDATAKKAAKSKYDKILAETQKR
jgi:hypothetical protein